ncbi:MAG: ATPase [Nitrososphaerota archaeon]|nr:ATPase [Nitrososphaerota archaeon]
MDRVKTGIAELDRMLGGGFMQGDAVMVAGSAGTGKTTLGLQYLYNGITKFGENGIYVTFEQLPDQIYRDAANFGWDLKRFEEENRLQIVCTSPNLLLESGGGSLLEGPVKEIKPRRVVLDSLSHLAMYVGENELRKEAYRTIMWFKTRGLSSMFVWESAQLAAQSFAVTEVGMSFLVDTILLFRMVEIESSMKKALAVLKMRGSDHDKRLREYEITPQGIRVAAPFLEYEGVITGSPRRAAPENFMEMFRKAAKARK